MLTRAQHEALKGNFHKFSGLPAESRCLIWFFSLPTHGRIIPRPATTVPPIATVNHESRSVYLSVYIRRFTRSLRFYPITPYANLSQDILFVNWPEIRGAARGERPCRAIVLEAIENMRHLLFHFGSVWTVAGEYMKVEAMSKVWDELSHQLLVFKNLATLVLVLGWEQDKIKHHFEELRGLEGRPEVELKVRDRAYLRIHNEVG